MLSSEPMKVADKTENHHLAQALLKGFNKDAVYQFPPDGDGGIPSIGKFVNGFSGVTGDFHEFSLELAREWIRIKDTDSNSRELIFCHFIDLQSDQGTTTGFGIFLTDSRDKFLKVERSSSSISIRLNEGVNLKKMTDCVLILPGLDGEPAKLFFKQNMYDFESNIFTDRFLKAIPVHNNFYNTSNQLNILKAFVDQELEESAPLDKIEKMTRTAEYFNNHDHFDHKEYGSTLFEDPDHRAAFEIFREQYARENDISIADEFEISPDAVKKNFRRVRSVIKLDRNFHIYVHGNRQEIVRGYDQERGKQFYKLFFDEEN
jgi:hypothetical protein